MQVPLWDNRSGIPARDAWGRFVAERHRVQWPNLTFEMAASVRFSSKRYCRAEIVMFCLFFCIFQDFFQDFQDFSRFFLINLSIFTFFFFLAGGQKKLILFIFFFEGLEMCLLFSCLILSICLILSSGVYLECEVPPGETLYQ